jgi:cation:H+ antiporter
MMLGTRVNAWFLIALGLAAMISGAELLVRGGSRIAVRLSIPPIMVGLTIVSLGTSAPELAIGIESARTGTAHWRWETSSARMS